MKKFLAILLAAIMMLGMCVTASAEEGKSYKEIAQILNISEDQVKVNIFRARQDKKKKYQETEGYGL